MRRSRVTRRFGRAARILVPLLIVCLLPLLILEHRGPTLRVGIVNTDEGATVTLPSGEQQFVPFGRQLSAALLDTQEDSGAHIELLTIDTAVHGFETGSLDAIVLIPAGFSEHLATFGTSRARHAYVEVRIRKSVSHSTHALASYINETARTTLSTTLNRNLLEGIYSGLDVMKDGMTQASEGSEELASGTAQAAQGITQLHDGASELSNGLERFSAGIDELHHGSDRLAGGSSALVGGLRQLADGARELSGGVDELADGLTGSDTQLGLMDGINALVDGVNGTENSPGLVQGTRQLAEGNRQLADGVHQMVASLDPLRQLLPAPGDGNILDIDVVDSIAQARRLAQNALDALNAGAGIVDSPEAIAALKERLQQLVAQCPPEQPEFCEQLSGIVTLLLPQLDNLPQAHQQSRQALEDFLARTGTPEFEERLRRAQDILDVNGGLQGLLHGPQGVFTQLDALRTGTRQLADGAETLAERVGGSPQSPGLAQGVTQLRDGVERLQLGVTGRNRDGELVNDQHLAGGARQLADGAGSAYEGAAAFNDGLSRYQEGVGQAADGAHAITDGMRGLRSGSGAAADGLHRLDEGAHELARGLGEAEKNIPRYSPEERVQIVEVALSPVLPAGAQKETAKPLWSSNVIHGAHISTLAIIIWVVGAVILMRTAPFSQPQLSRPISAVHVTINSLRGPFIVGATLALVSLTVLWGVGGIQGGADAGASLSWSILTSLITIAVGVIAIIVIHQGLMAVSGSRNGPGVIMVALTVQLIPLVTSALFEGNSVKNSWVEWTPLGALVRSLQAAYFHDGVSEWLNALVILVLWAGGAFIVSILSVNRYRSTYENAALLEALRQQTI